MNKRLTTDCLLVASEEEEKAFASAILTDEFDLFVVRPELVIAIDGHLGALEVTIVSNNKEVPCTSVTNYLVSAG